MFSRENSNTSASNFIHYPIMAIYTKSFQPEIKVRNDSKKNYSRLIDHCSLDMKATMLKILNSKVDIFKSISNFT